MKIVVFLNKKIKYEHIIFKWEDNYKKWLENKNYIKIIYTNDIKESDITIRSNVYDKICKSNTCDNINKNDIKTKNNTCDRFRKSTPDNSSSMASEMMETSWIDAFEASFY